MIKSKLSEQGVFLDLQTQDHSAVCPNCGQSSKKLHSYYTRRIKDTALAEKAVYIKLQIRRLYCMFIDCSQKTFTERLPLVEPYARRTKRLIHIHTTVANFLGGEAESKLLTKLHMPISPDRLLHTIRQ